MIHSGSRNIGKQVAEYYNDRALEINQKYYSPIPNKDLAFLPADSIDGKNYLNDMDFCIYFSFANRECMMKDVEYAFNRNTTKTIEFVEKINIHHNYAAIENHFGKNVWVHRKGATSAKAGELGIIPGSMGSMSYIVRGKGNPESFMSCSHGAGRAMSRKKASETITIDQFKESMKGIVSLDVNTKHIDESAMAYKDISCVMSEQTDLVDIVHILKPLANMKG